MRKPSPKCAVAIVGAGPVGLMAANLLGAAGLDVIVFERSATLLGIPRAIAYDPETLRIFDQIGLHAELASGLIADLTVVYLNGQGRRLMDMNPPLSEFGYSHFGTFYQPELERVLLEGLARFPNVEMRFGCEATGHSQDDDGVDLEIKSPEGAETVRASFVVGCDGGASPTRSAIGAQMMGSTFMERWLVIDAIIPGHDVKDITFFCDPRRPAVRLPAVGDRVRFEFMQLPGETAETLASETKVRELLSPLVDVDRMRIERKTVYAFHARVADRWRGGRIFLAGDAAHMMPPFAGQGMNSGMKDAANLAWKLAAVVKGQADAAILATYEPERAPSVRTMVTLSLRLGAVIMPVRPLIARLRDVIFAGANLSPAIRRFIRGGGLLPKPEIGRSALSAGQRDGVVGAMLPQPLVSREGTRARLDSHLGFGRWCVLGFGVDPERELAPGDLATLRALDAAFVRLDPPSAASPKGLVVEDAGFLEWVRKRRVRSLLVRPDKFIAERIDASRTLASLAAFSPAPATASAPAMVETQGATL